MYEQVAEKLLQFPLFADYDLESLRWLADPQRYVYVKQGEIILHQDSSPERCHILIEGTASVKKRTEEYDIPIIVLHPGSFCGEISVMTDAPTAAQVQALEDSMLICLEKDDFFHMLSKYPSLERKLMRMLNEQVRNMENATWYRERESFLKLEHDVQTAKQIQHSFLPDSIAQPEGWHICSRFHPAREVAGDFYDCFLMSQGRRIGLIIADVCDKGIGAALFMALSRSLLRAYIEQNQFISRSLVDLLIDDSSISPRKRGVHDTLPTELSVGTTELLNAVTSTNEYIVKNHASMNMFVTVFMGVLNPITGKLMYVNAGHETAYIIGKDGIKDRLKPTGPAVGLFPDTRFKLGETLLEPGDILFTYTDGVPDARNSAGKRLGKNWLEDFLNHSVSPAGELIDCIEERLSAHRGNADQFDDITILIAQRSPQA